MPSPLEADGSVLQRPLVNLGHEDVEQLTSSVDGGGGFKNLQGKLPDTSDRYIWNIRGNAWSSWTPHRVFFLLLDDQIQDPQLLQVWMSSLLLGITSSPAASFMHKVFSPWWTCSKKVDSKLFCNKHRSSLIHKHETHPKDMFCSRPNAHFYIVP